MTLAKTKKTANFRVNRTDAARRQIDSAVRMLFSGEDPLAIFALTIAAMNILKVLSHKRTDRNLREALRTGIRPMSEEDFWRRIQRPADYFKHADKDLDAILNGGEYSDIDWTLFMACLCYKDLGFQFTPEMSAFTAWHAAMYHKTLLEGDQSASEVKQIANKMIGKPRREQLKLGKEFITRMRLRSARD